MKIALKEKDCIRDLAKQVLEISCSKSEQEKLQRYKDLNSLKVVKPPLEAFLPSLAHQELFPKVSADFLNPEMQSLAQALQNQINKPKILNTDMPVTKTLHSGLFATVTPWHPLQKVVRADEQGHATNFEPVIKDFNDIKLLQKPILTVDHQKTNESFEQMQELLGDILDVKKGFPYRSTCGWGDSVIDELVELRGLEQLYFDMVDDPDFVHEIMTFMTDGKLDLMQQFKDENILFLNNETSVGSASFSATDILPGTDFNPSRICEKNLWGFTQAQEFSSVSSEMLEEFILPYQKKLTKDFGLVSYGCCEAIEGKIKSIEKYISNLRNLSISPFTDIPKAVKLSEGNYVLTCKLHPNLIAQYNKEELTRYLKNLIEITNGYPVSFVFAEVLDYGKSAQVFLDALDIARTSIEKYWKN